VQEVLRSPGQPLDASARAFMEPRFGRDFSQVRVHTDGQAADSARAVNALAYTVGRDVVFGMGQYAPRTSAGQRLLGHELTHVVQQQSGQPGIQTHLAVGPANDRYEQEADWVAESVVSKASPHQYEASSASHRLQRACGSAAIGSVAGCIGVGGQDITDLGMSSDSLFLFKISCDEFEAGEEVRLREFARGILEGEIVEIHGFASADGDPTFNENLSCARAQAAKDILIQESVTANMTLFQHGATPGEGTSRRSVVITFGPQPTPEPEEPQNNVRDISGCSIPAGCPANFCQSFLPTLAPRAIEFAENIILPAIGRRVSSRVVPLWREYLFGGSSVKDLSRDFGQDFTNSTTTDRATTHLVDALRQSLESDPPVFPAGVDTVEIDLAPRIGSAIAHIGNPSHPDRMNFAAIGEIPGNIAGDIGKDQTTCQLGAQPSPFNDDRSASGTAKVTRNPDGTLTVVPSITFLVQDTIDLCPGNCGATIEQIATVPLSGLEATGISGDVPFTVEFPAPPKAITVRP
jgi:outer membrane protein OmpA-like peptidoglycan-associated protein